jgi:hypothetical protein
MIMGIFVKYFTRTSNIIEDIIVSTNRDNQMVDLNSQHFNHMEQNPPHDPILIFPDQIIWNLISNPFGSPIVHSLMIFNNTEVKNSQRKDVDVMAKGKTTMMKILYQL